MTHHVLGCEVVEADLWNALQQPFRISKTRVHTTRKVDLRTVPRDHHARSFTKTGQEHLHLHGGRVLRLIQHNKGIGQGAAPHKGKRRDLDLLLFDQFGRLFPRQEIIQRIVERLHIRIDLVLHITREEAELFTRFDRRTGQDNLIHVALNEHGHADSNREIGFTRARWADAKRKFVFEQVLDIGLLRVGARLNHLFTGLDLNGSALEHLHLIACLRCGLFFRIAHAKFAINVARFDAATGFQTRVKRLQNLCALFLRGFLTD